MKDNGVWKKKAKDTETVANYSTPLAPVNYSNWIVEPYPEGSGINADHLEESVKYVQDIIQEEAKLFDGNYTKIAVWGFGEGACLAYQVLYTATPQIFIWVISFFQL